jgi:hypothetical protein
MQLPAMANWNDYTNNLSAIRSGKSLRVRMGYALLHASNTTGVNPLNTLMSNYVLS